jgi:MOSC domain-containing protein YiiM
MSGTVQGIFLAPSNGVDLRGVETVRVMVGKGLEGDRYALGTGSFSRWPGTGRSVTLIESEVIDDVLLRHSLDLSNGRSRRNVVTRGVRLNDLVGRRFRIGAVLFRGDRLAEPCGYLEKKIGVGLEEILRGRGGLRADVLEEGVIRVGDVIEEVA